MGVNKGFVYNRIELAEREGFEPPIPFRVCRFSRPEPSTTRPPLPLLQFYYSPNSTAGAERDQDAYAIWALMLSLARRQWPTQFIIRHHQPQHGWNAFI